MVWKIMKNDGISKSYSRNNSRTNGIIQRRNRMHINVLEIEREERKGGS